MKIASSFWRTSWDPLVLNFFVQMGRMESQSPNYLSVNLPSHHIFGQRQVKIAKLSDVSFTGFSGSFQITGSGWSESKQDRGEWHKDQVATRRGHMDVMTVSCRHKDDSIFMGCNPGVLFTRTLAMSQVPLLALYTCCVMWPTLRLCERGILLAQEMRDVGLEGIRSPIGQMAEPGPKSMSMFPS